MQSYHPPHISISIGNPHKVMSSGRKQQVFSWWELSSTLWICLLHCFYQHGLASAISVVDMIMHSITWFSLLDYIFSRNNQGYYFSSFTQKTLKQNSPFPDKLLSAWGNTLIFTITCTVKVKASDKKKRKKERKKNAQVGCLAGRIHLE